MSAGAPLMKWVSRLLPTDEVGVSVASSGCSLLMKRESRLLPADEVGVSVAPH